MTGPKAAALSIDRSDSVRAGFIFTDDDRQKEQERASEYLHRFTTDGLHQLMDILDLPRGADKKVRSLEVPLCNDHALLVHHT